MYQEREVVEVFKG